MPFAQWHAPFENQDRFDQSFPIEEGSGAEHSIAVFDARRELVARSAMSATGAVQLHLLRGSYTFDVARRGTSVASGKFEVGAEPTDVTIAR